MSKYPVYLDKINSYLGISYYFFFNEVTLTNATDLIIINYNCRLLDAALASRASSSVYLSAGKFLTDGLSLAYIRVHL